MHTGIGYITLILPCGLKIDLKGYSKNSREFMYPLATDQIIKIAVKSDLVGVVKAYVLQ